MNYTDFFTQPNGFPLESDATLGFMQSDYQTAINGLGNYLGNDKVIVSGLVHAGANASDGWIMLGGELIFFQGGVRQATFVVTEVWVQKANENGALVNRYKTKKAQFGTGSVQYNYADLQRLEGIQALQNRILDAVLFEPEIALSGLVVSSVNVGLSTLAISAGVAVINRTFVTAPAFAGTYPVYLKLDGTWTNTLPASDFIKFDPYTSQKLADVIGRVSAPTGDVRMRATMSASFDGTGLGKWELKGWALCNGANGTIDLRSRFVVAHDPRTVDPTGNFWDAAYATVGATGGEKLHTLSIGEMPAHRHTNDTIAAGDTGMVKKSVVAQPDTPTAFDSINSGDETNIRDAPVPMDIKGGGGPHENRPPFKVLVYIQRL